MRTITTLATLGAAAAAVSLGFLDSAFVRDASAGGGKGGGSDGGVAADGRDVIVGALQDITVYGTVNGIAAYAVGTTSCNIGTQLLSWIDSGPNDTLHPVIAQNMFRYKDGRFEQIGMSWLKHGWCAIDGNLCGTCQSGTNCDYLGIGCSDPYGAGLNGAQGDLGPRSQVNAATGAFPFPFTAPTAAATVGRRLQVDRNDLDPAQNAGAQYFVEGHYVHPEDAADGNDDNNASYRRLNVGGYSGTYQTWLLSLTGPTTQQKPAIYAWKDIDSAVSVVAVDVPNDGRFLVAGRATENGDGTWHYEYAVQNLNSDRCAAAFRVPLSGATFANTGFHDVFYHSGENYSGDDWATSVAGGKLEWRTDTYNLNPNANAIRFSTLYNFRFDSPAAPADGLVELGMFKISATNTFTATLPVPGVPPIPGDLNGDYRVNGVDLATLLVNWGTPASDIDGDGSTGGSDLAILLSNWTN
ncbi:MAG: hypothetical protein RIS86_2204 [Planctomycetota bacterium]